MPRERSLVQRSRLLGERILLRERIPQTRDLSAGQSGEPLKRDQLPDLEIRIREFQGTNLANLAGSAGFRDRGGERACLPLFSLIAIESIAGDSRLAFRNVSATPPPPPPPPGSPPGKNQLRCRRMSKLRARTLSVVALQRAARASNWRASRLRGGICKCPSSCIIEGATGTKNGRCLPRYGIFIVSPRVCPYVTARAVGRGRSASERRRSVNRIHDGRAKPSVSGRGLIRARRRAGSEYFRIPPLVRPIGRNCTR